MKKLTLLDLPLETQKDIFKWSRPSDLIALSLVSRHFHAIASSQLWRTFAVILPDDNDSVIDSTLDRLIHGLDTLATSEHKYGRHIKRISVDTSSGGDQALRACKQYGYDSTCGKLMSTLFMVALKDAMALDTFNWNVRIEISRPVFAALHKLPALQSLRIRLQQGPSLYQPPRRFTYSPMKHSYSVIPHVPLSSALSSAPPTPPLPYPTVPGGATSMSKQLLEPPTFSGFKSLSDLNILDIDDLSYVSEISACIKNSSSTLKHLKLSLSESFAAKAHKPIINEDEDSEDEMDDDIGNPIDPPLLPGMGGGTVEEEAKVRAEKLEQDAILGKILGITKAIPGERNTKTKNTDTKGTNFDQVALKGKLKSVEEVPSHLKGTILELTTTARLIMERMNASKDSPDSSNKIAHRNALDVILEAIEKQVRAAPTGSSVSAVLSLIEMAAVDTQTTSTDLFLVDGKNEVQPLASLKGKGKEKATDPIIKDNGGESGVATENTSDSVQLSAMPKSSASSPGEDLRPEDIDVDYPDYDPDEPEDEVSGEDNIKASEDLALTETIYQKLRHVEKLISSKSNGFVKEPDVPTMKGALGETRMKPTVDRKDDNSTETTQVEPMTEPGTTAQSIKDYIRAARKIPLEELSLYLIPMRPSVLARALDLTALRCITLLNVGPQAPFWIWMTHVHKSTPLQLKNIHTDNVTREFLSFVNVLDEVSELFLFERSVKAKVLSSAQSTPVVMEDIRKLVLQKHTKFLRKLMIKNENDLTWDLNARTVRLLAKKGKKLKELSMSTSMESFHLFLQHISGFDSLEALHVMSVRTNDQCTWVINELQDITVDNIAHYPHLRLKYVAVSKWVKRVIRHSPDDDKSMKEKRDKEESLFSVDSEDDDDVQLAAALKVSTVPTNFHRVSNYRIFRKDVRAGTL